ncbi:Protein PNS1 [Escovopsis weberi]|uniref:Protein PNS1 n=1 Tax=Escovopsis weberi TaxID=150374 RepID=A0A0M8N8A2_ESCWE|nr:Protein PNS1 [Escovopsis weberi]
MGEADSFFKPGQRGPPPPQHYREEEYPLQPYQQQQQQQPYTDQHHPGGYSTADYHAAYGAPPPYSFNPPQASDEKYSYDDAFRIEKPKYHDAWAGILLILVFAGYVAISAIVLRGYITGRSGSGIDHGNDFSLNSNTIVLFACCLIVAFILSLAYVWMARVFTRLFIWATGILNIAWALGTSIFYLYRAQWSAGIVFLVFAIFFAFAFWTWIPRIPFSALMLKTSVDVSRKHGHVYLVSFIGGLIATAMAAWFSVTLVAIYVTYQPSRNNPKCGNDGSGCGHGLVIGLVAYVTFAMYWITEWLKNTVHTTVAGVYGSWYFSPHNLPRGATRGAARRALTYSFGSISLGSLLVAILQFLRQVCSVIRDQGAAQGGLGSIVADIVFCILGCLLSLMEWAVQFINRYAFVHIALYGKGYIGAAKDTWRMVKDRGIDALVNDCLIGPVFSFGALFIAFACALFAYLYLLFTDPAYNHTGGFTAVVMAYAFLIGFQIAHVFTTPLSSGIDTIFVAAGWDPQVMMRDHPELYNEMGRVYPKIHEAIH